MPDVLELGELVVVEALDLQMRGAREVLVSVDVFEKTEMPCSQVRSNWWCKLNGQDLQIVLMLMSFAAK